jgi:hypothetical protein
MKDKNGTSGQGTYHEWGMQDWKMIGVNPWVMATEGGDPRHHMHCYRFYKHHILRLHWIYFFNYFFNNKLLLAYPNIFAL